MVAYLTVPPPDLSGCYSMSIKLSDPSNHYRVGFGVNTALHTTFDNSGVFWQTMAFLDFNGDDTSDVAGRGTQMASDGMGRAVQGETITLIYNPQLQTLHGAYDLEPLILLRNAIRLGQRGPLQPFVAFLDNSGEVEVVTNPRWSLE